MTWEGFSPDVLSGFGGLCTIGRDPNTVPRGLSPDCQDARFSPGYVGSRDGFGCHLTNTSAVMSIASFVRDGVRRLLVLYADGRLTVESPEGTETVLASNMGTNLKMKATTLFRKIFFALSDGRNPQSVPWQYDGTNLDRIGTNGPASQGFALAGTGGGGGGSVVDGIRYYFVAYRTRSGQTTRCSAPQKITLAGGPQKFNASALPIGPANVTARLIYITLSGGSDSGPFYNLPDILGIADNSTTSLSNLDFSETELANGEDGTELLTKILLPACLGVTRYGDRLVSWGLLDDRTSNPSYWVLSTAFGTTNLFTFDTIVSGAPVGWLGLLATNTAQTVDGEPGYSLRIQGTADGNAAAFYLNKTYAPIRSNTLSVGRKYGMRVRARRTSGAHGTLVISVKNDTGGGTTYATATFDIATDIGETWAYLDIPTNGTVFAVGSAWVPYVTITGFDAESDYVYFGEMNIYDTDPGDLLSSGLISIDTAEDFDPERSYFQVSPGDGQQLMCCFQLAGNLYGAKEHSLWATQENGGDPISWIWQNVSEVCGAASPHAVGRGNRFVVLACRSGVYYFDGGEPQKISQDIEPTWKTIDWTQREHIWVVVDPEKKVVKIGIPTDPDVSGCTQVLSADYVQGWGDGSKSDATNPLSPSLKWVPETLTANCAEMSERDDDSQTLFLGGGLASSNDVPNTTVTFSEGAPVHWETTGTDPTETAGQADAMGGTTATRLQFVGGANLISLTLADVLDDDDYYTLSIRLKMKTAGETLQAVLRPPGLFKGTDVPETETITITDEWQRFVWTLGPFRPDPLAGPHVYESIILDLGTGASDILIGSPQIQKGQYDFGECQTTGTALEDIESGFIAEPVEDQHYDFCGPVQFVYETANWGAATGRSTFGGVNIRGYGAGELAVQWVRPDGTKFNFHGGVYPVLASAERDDIELKSNEQATQARLRFTQSAKDSWCVLQRIGIMYKPAEFATFRGQR